MFNEYQTQLDSELVRGLPEEVHGWLLDAINSVPFIGSLVSADRKRACDLERRDGRIVVDLCNPHIIEGVEYFLGARRHFERHGCYTFLRPNSNPNSEFHKWLVEETRRCLDGMVRESDGEWIPGTLYFQLNYSPMMVNITRDGSNIADRVEAFPAFWEGLYLRHHYLHQARYGGLYNEFLGGNHCAELSRRGSGKSYSLASIMASRLLIGESLQVQKRVTTILTAYLKEYLGDKDGTFSKFTPILDHCAEFTHFKRSKVKDSISELAWTMGYKDKVTGSVMGSRNNVNGVSVKDNEGKLRGKRGYIFFEEFGTFPNLLKVYNNVRYSVEEGNSVFALLYLIGTAGDKDSDFYSAQELIYQPRGYNIYALPNVYDRLGQGGKYFSFFFPGYLNRPGCYNDDGVSDVIKALVEIFMERYRTKYNSKDPETLVRVIAEIPITPQDAIRKVSGSMFPSQDLNELLLAIDSDTRFYDTTLQGEFVMNGNRVDFKMTDARAIREFPIKEFDRGAVEIYEMPVMVGDRPMQGRYCIGIDPYESDNALDSVSLGSCICLDLFTDRVVCEYTGRTQFADDFFEICRRMALFYGCKINYENNKKGLYSYFRQMNSLYLLEDTFEYLRDKNVVHTSRVGNSGKGTPASAPVNKYARELLRDWLCMPIIEKETTPEGDIIEHSIVNLTRLKGRAMIKELASWNSDGNFDRVSAMMMVMLYRQHYMIMYGGNIERAEKKPKNKLAHDKFFESNFRGSNVKGKGADPLGYIAIDSE